jgi:competence protein CoiA
LLNARTKTGKNICLGYDYKKETLLYLRSKEEFLCPICGESVLLKLGDSRIFHFAHKQGGTCRDFYESETFSHMEGKRQLYQWLNRQKIPSVLEYYDRKIQQRPDIMFTYNRKRYALEYQCSTIPESVFIKRTTTYLKNGYIPLWILSSNHIHQKKQEIVGLSNFHYLFLRSTSSGTFYIPTYCPDKQLFHFVESITSYSIKNAFAQHSYYQANKTKLESLLEPKMSMQLNLSSWNSEMEKSTLNWSLHPGQKQKEFLHELYNRNLNPFLLPPEIGLPVPHSVLIQTSPLIWQTYLFIDVLANKKPHDLITLQEINVQFKKRIRRNDIILRKLPQVMSVNPLLAVTEYLQHLERLEIVTRKGDMTFQLQRKIIIPKSNREMEQAKRQFFQNYHRLLTK